MKRNAVIGLVLIVIMFVSSIAFAFLQSLFYFPTQPNNQQQVKLPESDIVDYELSQTQEIELLRNGRTILKYSSPLNCVECQQDKNFLEILTARSIFSGQLALQEITSPENSTSLEIYSVYGSEKLAKLNQSEIIVTLCRLVANPPAACALQNVK